MESADSRSTWLRLAKAAQPNLVLKSLSGAAIIWAALQDDGSNASAVHMAFVRETWMDISWAERIELLLGFALRFPVMVAAIALLTRRCGPRIRRATGKGLFTQAREQLSLARKQAVPPMWYYMFEFYEDERRRHALEYLYRFETKAALYATMRKWLSDPASAAALSDKAAFSRRCGDHGVPAVQVLATVRHGSVQRLDDGDAGLPHRDLFVKPLRGAGGRGASRWTYRQDGLYLGDKGTVFSEARLVAFLGELSRIEDYVIRARVSNHRDLADLCCDALSTVRVVTCLDREGVPEVTHAVLRMPSSNDAIVDNFHAGGVAAAVDLETGTLGRATDMGLRADSRWWDTHPVSGAPITGRVVPMWRQVLELARSAHAIFADQVAIGWDIAVCGAGPLLVEGNKSPDLDIIQRVRREPLGNSRLGELLLFHIVRAQGVQSKRHPAPGPAESIG